MPNLVELRLVGCYPPPADVSFAGSLKQFSVHFEDENAPPYEMVQLTRFLSSCIVLERVALNYLRLESVTPCPLKDIASVQDIEFSFRYCTLSASSAICSSIHFPNASSVTLVSTGMKVDKYPKGSLANQEWFIEEILLLHSLARTFHLDYEPNTFCPHRATDSSPPGFGEACPILSVAGRAQILGTLIELRRFLPPPIRILEIFAVHMETKWQHLSDWAEKNICSVEEARGPRCFRAVYNTRDWWQD